MTSGRLPAGMLNAALAPESHNYIFLIGGGGKTTLMYALAHDLVQGGRTVVSTTSTKILCPEPADATCVIVEPDPGRAAARLQSELPSARHVTLGKSRCDGDRKLSGFAADELDALWRASVTDYLIVEADGAAGRSLKAHATYEPVISSAAELVIAVIGSDCVARPLDDAHVHRARRFAELLGRTIGTPVSTADVAAIFFHPQGYLKAVPPHASVIVLLGKAGGRETDARRLAGALRAADRGRRIARLVLGELTGPQPFLALAE